VGILSTISEALTLQMYQGFVSALIPRGLAIPLDKFATGEIRFGNKIEFVLPIIAPDNKFIMTEEAIFQMDRIVLDHEPKWISPGGFIYIGKRELHEVADISYNTVLLTVPLMSDQPVGQPVYHYSEPIKVEGSYDTGNDTINVDTEYFMVRGDVIAISSSLDLTLSFREYTVVDLQLVSTIGGINQYQVYLDKGIHRDIADEEIIQLRAYVAYRSKILELPIDTDKLLFYKGPALIDWWSSPFVRDLEISETQTLYRYNSAHILVAPPEIINKNYTLLSSIEADQFLFWDKVDGNIGFDGDTNRLMIKVNKDLKWWLKHTCAPKIKVPFTYAAGSIVTPDPTQLTNNEWFRIYDGTDATVFEYKVNTTYTPTPSIAATGIISLIGATLPTNNDSFFLDDGFGVFYNFEYMDDAGTFIPTPGYYPIDITTEVFAVEVAIKTIAAINTLAIGITATLDIAVPPVKVTLINNKISLNGNQPIVLDAGLVALGWTATGMSGGTDKIETIDISAATITTGSQVAALTSAAITRTNMQVTATLPGVFNSFKLFSTLKGTLGNYPITRNIASLQFIIMGMSGGTGGVTWHFLIKPAQSDALMRIRLYPNAWLPDVNLLAGVDNNVVVALSPLDQDVERIDLLVKATDCHQMTVTFDAPPNATQAEVLTNYNVPGLVLSGTPILNGNTVTLWTTAQAYNTIYTITVSGVTRASDAEPLDIVAASFTGAPTFNITSAVSSGINQLTITFDAPPNATQSTVLSNYKIPGLTLSGTPVLVGNKVLITTSAQLTALYNVTVVNITREIDAEPLIITTASFTGSPTFNVASAASSGINSVIVTFDAPPNATQAVILGNYNIPGLTLSGIPVLTGNQVTLTTSAQTYVTSYTVTIINVTRADDAKTLTINTAVFRGSPTFNVVSAAATGPGEIEMGAWIIATQETAAVAHEYIMQLYGNYTAASTTLWAKPLFPNKEDLKLKLDTGAKLDSGTFLL